jgi:ABC-2 type transport system permease protein
MYSSLKSELRKLLTVRSTYVILGLALLALLFFAFYLNGLKATPDALASSNYLVSQATQAMHALAGMLALVGLLLMTHEYRYNTIMYTLTTSNSRLRTLLAKFITVTCFALVTTLLVTILSPALAYLGIHLAGHQLGHQVLPVKELLWHCLYFGWGFAMLALLLAALIRNQVGAIVAFFLIPGPVEALLGLLLKQRAVYLPASALGQVLANPTMEQGGPGGGHLSPARGALVFGAYVVVGWIVAGILFLKRDAN